MALDLIQQTGDIPRPEPVSLRAGPFSLELHGCDLRHITLGGREVVQRLYMGLRDQNWGTLESHIKTIDLEDRGDSFTITLKAENRKGDIVYDWKGRFEGTADGVITYAFTGTAGSEFPRARISLCALFPWSARETECKVRHNNGGTERKTLPRHISPHQPFMDIKSIAMTFPGIGETVTTFEGEVFEMEDQRNWTDASFKVYGTPIASPAPVTVRKGEALTQSIRVECRNLAASAEARHPAATADATVFTSSGAAHVMPMVGLSFAPEDGGNVEFARSLRPGLVRVYMDYTAHSRDVIEKQFADALAVAAPLLVEPFFREDAGGDLEHALRLAASAPKGAIWGVSPLGVGRDVSPAVWLDAFRAAGVPAGWGSDGFPVHINRNRPGDAAIDFCVFPALPQVHSFDNMSIIDNLPGMTAVAENARAFQKSPIVLAPVTFNWRSNPVAVAPEPARADDSPLPVGVDARQQSLFGAAWLVACCQALAEGGAAGAVFFECVTGWKGLREAERPEAVSGDFPVVPGQVFPVATALRWLATWKGAGMVPFSCSGVRGAGGFAMKKNDHREGVFLYNLSTRTVMATVRSCTGLWNKRTLDAGTYAAASAGPDAIAAERCEILSSGEIALPPCSLFLLEKMP